MRQRPEILFPLFSSLSRLNGVGAKTQEAFHKRGIHTPLDLLFSLPERYVDRTPISTIQGQILPAVVTVRVTPTRHAKPPKKSMPYRVWAEDEKSTLQLVFFHANEAWIKQKLTVGVPVYVSGLVEQFDGQGQMVHPTYIEDNINDIPRVEPIYPSGEGLSQKLHRQTRAQLLSELATLPEWSTDAEPSWGEALRITHQPSAEEETTAIKAARDRLVYDELLAHQLTLALARQKREAQSGRALSVTGALRDELRKHLPFEATNAQEAAIKEIDRDLLGPKKMHRLLQGDVGSGKTLVALMAMLSVVEYGEQAVLMAPTSVLASQHFLDIGAYAKMLGVDTILLTGQLSTPEANSARERIRSGEAQIIIGTHALIQETVAYHNLGLAIIDEQHRFGVEERMALDQKGDHVDQLVMSATPIPRTIALASYGDMDISILDEKPAGRQPIDTAIIPQERINAVIQRLAEVMKDGRQAYWICPLVEESEKLDLTSVTERFDYLNEQLPDIKIGLIHGRMSGEEKKTVMGQFLDGTLSLLLATTVIEVGVNVPNATIIVIDHAEHFGLAQLHQLRGRVGRGDQKSNCVLLYQGPLGRTAQKRLETIRATEDGFEIAEVDLKLRGAGDVLGIAQSGLPRFHMADLETDGTLFHRAHDEAKLIATADPELSKPRGEALQILLHLMGYEGAMHRLQRG